MTKTVGQTSEQRRAARWETKRYAKHAMRKFMRSWAKAKRINDTADDVRLGEYARDVQFGMVLGARGALRSVGALSQEQYDRISRRIERITRARITRRPFGELRRAA